MKFRHITISDRDAFYDLIQKNKDRLADYFPVTLEKTATPDITAESIKMYQVLLEKGELYTLLVENDEAKIIGLVFIKNIDPKTRKCELGYFIDKDEEGKGIMNKAIKETINIAFNDLGLNKIYCRIGIDNIKSNNLVLRNGFKLEGVLREDHMKSDGTLIDLNYYGLLKSN